MKHAIIFFFLFLTAVSANAQSFKTNFLKYSSTGLNSESGADFIDFDGDGNLDVLAGFESRKHLLLFKNQENTFDIEALSDTSYGFGLIKRVDFNQDGFDDILVSQRDNGTSYNVYLYLNDSNYNYTTHFVFSTGYDRIEHIDVADMDADGDLDLVIDVFANSNVFYKVTNNGNYSFTSSHIAFVGQPAELYGLADLNNDGLMDVVGAYYNFSVSKFILVAAENDTALTSGFVIHNIDTMANTNEGVVGNFVGTSLPDIFLSAQTSGTTAAVWQNNGNFTFSLVTQPVVPTSARVFLPNDYDGDGDLDVILSTFSAIEILKNNGNSTFTRQVIAPNAYINPVAWDDFNNDGLNDLLLQYRGNILVYAQNSNGQYHKFWANNDFGSGNLAIFDADLNGKKDIVGSEYYSSTQLNQTFDEKLLPTNIQDSTGMAFNITLRDFHPFDKDSDGDMELLVGQGNTLYMLTNNQGTFTASTVSSTINSARNIQEGDFDQDGNPDFIVLGNLITHLEWNGSTFTQSTLPENSHLYAIVDADVDGDEDIVYLNYDIATMTTNLRYFKYQSGSFTSTFIQNATTILGNNATGNDSKMHHADIDQDGDEDLFVVSYQANRVVWFRNDSNAVFVPTLLTSTVTTPKEVRVIDIDGDGDLDILLTSLVSANAYLFTNDGNENFTQSIFTTEVSRPTNIVVNDYDQDGDDDIFISSPIDDKLVWFENLQIDCPRTFGAASDSICYGDSLQIGGIWVNQAGMYVDSLNNAMGCDSIISFALSVYQEPGFALMLDSNLLYAGLNLSALEWYKNNSLLASTTSDTLDALIYGNGSYFLVGRNANGCIVYSDTLLVNLNFSIAESNPLRQIQVYPNPAQDFIAFSGFVNQAPITCRILSAEGKLLLKEEMYTSEKIQLSQFADGLYLLQIEQGNLQRTLKLVISR